MEPFEHDLLAACAALGVDLHETQLAQFRRYALELEEWNQHTNLTAIRSTDQIYTRHFLDSLTLAPFLGDHADTMIDIGSGAGFPGLPLKICFPHLHLTLSDSVGKKTAFLRHIVSVLELTDVRVLTERAEDLGRRKQEREHYAVVTARAVADLRVLLEYCLPLTSIGGRVLAPKGPDVAAEVAAAQHAAQLLGSQPLEVVAIQATGLEARSLVIAHKAGPTDKLYPRAVGIPNRKPL